MEFYKANLEVLSGSQSQLAKSLPDSEGAFVYVVVRSSGFQEALREILFELKSCDYTLKSIEYFSKYSDFESEADDQDIFDDLVRKGIKNPGVTFGDFYCYPE